MSRCVIVSAAPVADPTALRVFLCPDDYVIAADGGWQLAKALGLTPAVLVADFDSMPSFEAESDVKVVRLPVKKDETDTAAAVEIGLQQGCDSFLLLGCTGGRLDHQQAALATAARLTQRGCEVTLADEKNEIRVLTPGDYVLSPRTGCKCSLFAFGGPVRGLTATGLAYPLEGYELSPFDPLCVSNEFTGEDAHVSFCEGVLLLYVSKD